MDVQSRSRDLCMYSVEYAQTLYSACKIICTILAIKKEHCTPYLEYHLAYSVSPKTLSASSSAKPERPQLFDRARILSIQ